MSSTEPVLALDARMELLSSRRALAAQPGAGGVFVLRPGVRGRLPNRFAG